jgi:hypothetical protein
MATIWVLTMRATTATATTGTLKLLLTTKCEEQLRVSPVLAAAIVGVCMLLGKVMATFLLLL